MQLYCAISNTTKKFRSSLQRSVFKRWAREKLKPGLIVGTLSNKSHSFVERLAFNERLSLKV
jgi:hypothetical protein